MTIVKAFYDTFKRSASVILCRQCQKDDEEDDNVTNLLEASWYYHNPQTMTKAGKHVVFNAVKILTNV